MDITINKDEFANMLGQTSAFIGATAPKLEKLANYEADLDTSAVAVVEKLASVGLVRSEEKATAIEDLTKGGIAKMAEVFDYVVNKLVKAGNDQSTTRSMGKQASASNSSEPEVLTADQVFERKLGIK